MYWPVKTFRSLTGGELGAKLASTDQKVAPWHYTRPSFNVRMYLRADLEDKGSRVQGLMPLWTLHEGCSSRLFFQEGFFHTSRLFFSFATRIFLGSNNNVAPESLNVDHDR